jgi:hypothetical protein
LVRNLQKKLGPRRGRWNPWIPPEAVPFVGDLAWSDPDGLRPSQSSLGRPEAEPDRCGVFRSELGSVVPATADFEPPTSVINLPPGLQMVSGGAAVAVKGSYLVDPASSHMLVSKIKPCMSKYKQLYSETANGSLNQL